MNYLIITYSVKCSSFYWRTAMCSMLTSTTQLNSTVNLLARLLTCLLITNLKSSVSDIWIKQTYQLTWMHQWRTNLHRGVRDWFSSGIWPAVFSVGKARSTQKYCTRVEVIYTHFLRIMNFNFLFDSFRLLKNVHFKNCCHSKTFVLFCFILLWNNL